MFELEVAAMSSCGDHIVDFARKHGIASVRRDFRDLPADKTIAVVDI